jgi:hypothetical protein
MNLLDATFAKLNFEYDRPRAFMEMEQLFPLLDWTRTAPGMMDVAPPFSVNEVFVGGREDSMITAYTWKSIGLTHLPGHEASKLGRGSMRNRYTNDRWAWRDDIFAPYVRQLCESLPFEKITVVRLIVLPAGNTGTVHHDDPSNIYYSSGGRSLTLNIESGGRGLEFMREGRHYTIGDHPAFIFRDDCFHGVRKVERVRVQLRVNGFFSPAMENLIDRSKVVM